jgi:hypothetical protein
MMKKLKAILGGKLDRAVLAAKEKRINAQLQLAKVNKEEELEAAKNQVETLYTKLGNKDLPSEESKEIIENLIEAKFEVIDAQETLEVINSIIEELNSEIEVSE